MTDEPVAPILLEEVTYRVGETALVSGLSLKVEAAQTLVLLGRSGSGKTTALRLMNGLLRPTEGRVLVEGRSTEEWDPIQLRRKIGYVIQEVGLFPHFTVSENVGLVPMLEGWSEPDVRRRTDELLTKVGLDAEPIGARYPHQLSGGQRQRVGVARALAADPPFLLMDEPFGALDLITRAEIQREFLTIRGSLRKTIVFVTHDVREGLLLADQLGVLEAGRLVWSGTPEQFRSSGDAAAAPFLECLS